MKKISNEDFDDLLASRRPALLEGYDLTGPQYQQLAALKRLLTERHSGMCPKVAAEIAERDKVREAAKRADLERKRRKLLEIEARIEMSPSEQMIRARQRANNRK